MDKTILDILWVVLSACLVCLMQAGFLTLETGFTRNKNNINVAIKNLADFGVSILMFWGFGFGLMFGQSYFGLFGGSGFLLQLDNDSWLSTFFFFQAMFCGTAVTIVSGSAAERLKFSSYLIIAMLVSLFVYPIYGHWIWNGINLGLRTGWLGAMGFVDFSGAAAVHMIGGWVSLAVLIVIGARHGRFWIEPSAS